LVVLIQHGTYMYVGNNFITALLQHSFIPVM